LSAGTPSGSPARYADRLLHNFHELSAAERYRYRAIDRLRFGRERRFLFEGCRAIRGQLWVADRRALYETVLRHRPRHCFEIGTWTGGGSTYFLARAFASLGRGKVITLESDLGLHEAAVAMYRRHLPDLIPYVEFLYGDSPEAFLPFLGETGGVDCCFLDGAEDPAETMAQFTFFDRLFEQGSIVMAHDWETDKATLLRPALEQSDEWTPELRLGPPESVGFAVFTRSAGDAPPPAAGHT